LEEVYQKISTAVIDGYPEEVKRAINEALEMGLDPLDIFREGLVRGIRVVGENFERGELWLAHLILAGTTMSVGSDLLRDAIEKKGYKMETIGRFIICTVQGDIHDIGKNIVATLLKVEGFEVIDLGKDVPTELIVQKVKELKPDILGLSALLTTTMIKQKEVIEALKEAGLRDKVKVIIGGAPTSAEWAREIGADGWAPDALSAVRKAKELLGLQED